MASRPPLTWKNAVVATRDVFLDGRRRTSLAKVGRPQDDHYLADTFDDGTIVLTPAVTISAVELAVLSDPESREALTRAAQGRSRPPLAHRGFFANSPDEDWSDRDDVSPSTSSSPIVDGAHERLSLD